MGAKVARKNEVTDWRSGERAWRESRTSARGQGSFYVGSWLRFRERVRFNEKSSAYVEWLNYLTAAGCPVCSILLDDGRRYLDRLFYESVADGPTRIELLKSFGFCSWHTWQVASLPAVCVPEAGFSIFAADLLARFDVVVDRAYAKAGKKKRLGAFFGKKAGHLFFEIKKTHCPACRHAGAVEAHRFRDLLEFVREDEFVEAYRKSSGICLPHFDLLEQRHSRHPDFPIVLELERCRARALRDALEEYVRKQDHAFDGKIAAGERKAWKAAMEFLAGKPGVFPNKMGREPVPKSRGEELLETKVVSAGSVAPAAGCI
jgi:hypothetical protein